MNLACKKIIQLLFAFGILFSFSNLYAQTPAPICASLFESKTYLRVRAAHFVDDVRKTRGGALAFKTPETGPETKRLGFATKDATLRDLNKGFGWIPYLLFDFVPHMFGSLITWDLNYTLTPFKPIGNVTFNPLTRWVTKTFSKSKNPKDLRLWVKLPIIIAMANWGTDVFDSKVTVPVVIHNTTMSFADDVAARPAEFDDKIQNNFRFKDIKDNLESGQYAKPIAETDLDQDKEVMKLLQAPETRARVFARELMSDYENYYELADKFPHLEKLTAQEEVQTFGDPHVFHRLFHGIQFFIENGVQEYPGTVVQKTGPLNETQIQKLYIANHILYLKYRLLESSLVSDEVFQQLQGQFSKNAMLKKTFEDPYTLALEDLKNKNLITREQLQYYLEEDAYYQFYFQMFSVLGITNLKMTDNGYSNEPMTLNDVRQARLNQVTSTSSSMR